MNESLNKPVTIKDDEVTVLLRGDCSLLLSDLDKLERVVEKRRIRCNQQHRPQRATLKPYLRAMKMENRQGYAWFLLTSGITGHRVQINHRYDALEINPFYNKSQPIEQQIAGIFKRYVEDSPFPDSAPFVGRFWIAVKQNVLRVEWS